MAVASIERRLAAILAADVVGYSRLMAADEEGTLARLRELRGELVDPKIAEHHGRIVKLMGDGALVEFASVVDAVRCAVDIQRTMAGRDPDLPEGERVRLRIGVNLGDVIIESDDIYGDGVNIAARLEALAEPGGIVISGTAFDHARNKVEAGFEYLGEQQVKNIPEPVRTYRMLLDPAAAGTLTTTSHRPSLLRWAALAGAFILVIGLGVAGWRYYLQPLLQERAFAAQTALPLPDGPSIAVLPFANMSGDPDEDYFSDGMTDSLITDLSTVSGLFVIARNSTFAYKGRAVSVPDVGRELGVRYVLEGSVQRADDRVRINAQLIDAATGYHLWAERFDRELADVFALQDEVARRIVSALEIELTESARESLAQRYTDNLEAYDYFLRGWEQYWRFSDQGRLEARTLFERAIELDPRFARAYANLALTYTGQSGGVSDLSHERAYALARTAIALDGSLPQVHWVMGLAQVFRRQYAESLASLERAIQLDPNYADAYAQRAWSLQYAGKPNEALGVIEKAMRLNPHYPFVYLGALGETYFALRRYQEAIGAYQEGLRRNPTAQRQRMFLAASYAQVGRLEDAQWEMAELLTLDPDFTLDRVPELAPYKDPEPLNRLLDGLRKAGLT